MKPNYALIQAMEREIYGEVLTVVESTAVPVSHKGIKGTFYIPNNVCLATWPDAGTPCLRPLVDGTCPKANDPDHRYA